MGFFPLVTPLLEFKLFWRIKSAAAKHETFGCCRSYFVVVICMKCFLQIAFLSGGFAMFVDCSWIKVLHDSAESFVGLPKPFYMDVLSRISVMHQFLY